MRLTKIKFFNYRCFGPEEQAITIDDLTTFIGNNSAGKTAALSALNCMFSESCPYCGFLVERVFSDASGHKMIYCKKCKEEYPVNLGYFRRMKRRRQIKYQTRERQHR